VEKNKQVRLAAAILLNLVIGCGGKTSDKSPATPNQGYVLKREQGSVLPGSDSSIIVKVSPDQGSQNDLAIVQKIKPGKGTGLHSHKDVDEIFYVIEGNGTAVLGTKSYDIEAGDFIFIPKNLDHKIRKYDTTGILKLVFFMDKPGLLEFFKQRHQQFYLDKKPMTLAELNRVAEKYGTHFTTLN
jgi:mannose-6-phosphate isomerase-like protein (cupin superfamily)